VPATSHRPAAAAGALAHFAARVLALLGWRVVATVPMPAKCVLVFYPHTTNWDFVIGLLAKWALELPARWVAKDTLFRWPVAGILRHWGGIPVNRSDPAGFAERLTEEFRRAPGLCLAITPEGTRSRTEGWKSGFYRIALAARVPVVLAFIDYARREIGYADAFALTGAVAADMARIAAFYADRNGYRPANQGPVRLRSGIPD
jgi:1-acyl-sn-glycerol-3-phosphate acyltransferase